MFIFANDVKSGLLKEITLSELQRLADINDEPLVLRNKCVVFPNQTELYHCRGYQDKYAVLLVNKEPVGVIDNQYEMGYRAFFFYDPWLGYGFRYLRDVVGYSPSKLYKTVKSIYDDVWFKYQGEFNTEYLIGLCNNIDKQYMYDTDLVKILFVVLYYGIVSDENKFGEDYDSKCDIIGGRLKAFAVWEWLFTNGSVEEIAHRFDYWGRDEIRPFVCAKELYR